MRLKNISFLLSLIIVSSLLNAAPNSPQNLTATPGNQQVTLCWNQNTESDLAKYRIYRNTSSPATTLIDSCIASSPPDTFYVDIGLTNGQIYYYRIAAVDSAGNKSDFSGEVSAIPGLISWYVSTNGNDSNSGTITEPLCNIQTALNQAYTGDTIRVAGGTYSEGLIPQSAVVMRGGYSAGFSEVGRDIAANQTIIKAVSSTILTDNDGCTIDGFFFDGNGVAVKGIDVNNSTIFTHNVVAYCTQSSGFGLDITGPAIIYNNVIHDNVYGIYISSSGDSSRVCNNIITNNSFGLLINYAENVINQYNDLYNNTYNYSGTHSTPGVGDISLNPHYVDSDNHDFRLQWDSPCIDAGDPDTDDDGSNWDVDEDDRDPDGTRMDMGAYYFIDYPPAIPACLNAETANAKIILRWNANSEPDLAKYCIYRDTSSPATTLIDNVLGAPPDTFFTDTGLTNEQTYYYRITAVDQGDNESGFSEEMSATPDTVLYTVKTDGSGDFTSIQSAIDASTHGDTVLVHPGTYIENINFNGKNIVVGSLLLTTQDTSYISSTIIDGNQSGSVVTFESGEDSTAVLSGFIITNGSSNSAGGGIYCMSSSPKLKYLIVRENFAQNNAGGIYLSNYNNRLENLTVRDNISNSWQGGGLFISNSTVEMLNSKIIGNTAASSGGAIWITSLADVSITSSVIVKNHSFADGGAIYVLEGSIVNIINSTITENSIPQGRHGSGITLDGITTTVNIINSIVIKNIEGEDYRENIYFLLGTVNARNSCISSGYDGTTYIEGVWPGDGNIDVDPKFIIPDENNYNLDSYSNCIGAGIDSIKIDDIWYYAPTTDINGNPRPNPAGSNTDIGAYENALATPLHNSFIHVASTGNDVDCVGLESSPFASIQAAIDYSENSDTVLVQPGTYVENINFNGKNIVVGSLFLTAQDTSYISQTIIDGNQDTSVVIFSNGETAAAVLSGFTIQNGSAEDGGGICCKNNSSPRLTNLTLSGNTSSWGGGGIYCMGSSPNLVNVMVSGNTASHEGGGIYCQNSNLSLENVTISGNWSDNRGGGIFCHNCSPVLENVTISGNVASYGGGICFSGPSLSLINATISGNTADYGGGFYCGSSSIDLINTIVWNNFPQEIYFDQYGEPSSITIAYSNIQGGQVNIVTNNNGTINWGDGNINYYPLFVDTTNNDYNLSNYSPCIGTGIDSIEIDVTWYYAPTTDLDGNPRPNPAGSNPDMGAYESPRSVPLSPDAPTNLAVSSGNTQLTLSWSPSSAPSVDRYYIYRSTTQGFTPSGVADTIASVDDSVSSYTDINLNNETTYYYRVSAVDGLGNESDYSDEVSGIPNPTMITVKTDGTGDFTYIQTAIDATTDGDTVLVYPGTYVENINFNGKEIVVKSRDGADVTIIDGNQKDAVVTCNSSETHNSILKGFTIKNGYRGIGGGIFCFEGSPSLIDLIIKNNTAECHGGGISCHNSKPSLTNVLIAENYSSIDDGGGIWLTSGSNPILNNVSIVNNHAVTRGGGILCKDGSHPSVINSIIWGNTTPEILFYDEDGYAPNSINICHSLIFGGQDSIITNGIGTVNYGNGNIDTNPLFINSSSDNYHILDYSPCIGAGIDSIEIDGTWYYAPTTDIDGNPRPNPAGSRPDMGAYENALGGIQPAVVSLSSDSLKFKSVGVGKTDTLELTIYNISLASVLTVSDIQSSNSVFTVSQSNFVVPADDSAVVEVYFIPDAVINYTDSLTISSNAANKPNAKIYLSAEGKIIISHTPTQNALNVSKDTDISVTFGVDMNSSTINSNTFIVHASQTGLHAGVYSYDAGTKTATFNPADNFTVGENLTVTLTTGIQTSASDPLPNPYEWSFTIEVDGGSGVFQPKTDYTAGSHPHSIFSSDLDGDGDMDLAVANRNSDNVSILLNNGDGTFQSKTDYSTGSNPLSVFLSDFNGDRDIDIAVADEGSNTVSILLNNGNGTFQDRTSYPTGIKPRSVFSSDLDSDGDMDLAIADDISSTVSVLLNSGDGAFQDRTSYPTGNNPYSVFSSDIDGDGDMDLIVANLNSSTVSTLLNNGDGTFQDKIDYSTGSNPRSVSSSDLDSDGDMDLITTNYNSSTISILLNNGDGTFQNRTDYSTGSNPTSVFSTDLDGDGDIDLAVTNLNSSTVSALINNGDGTFQDRNSYPTVDNPMSIFSSDFDSDGDMDIAVANWSNSNTVSVLLNRNKEADISLSTNSINFGGVKIDSTMSMQFTIYNNGVDSTLQITNLTSSNSVFVPSPSSGVILSDDSLIVTVAFTPTAYGNYQDRLAISCNDPHYPIVYLDMSGFCGSFISGIITSDTTWTKTNSPYIVNGNLAVDTDVTLTLEAGAEIRFDGYYNFNIYGNLIVNGTIGDTVLISSVASPSPGLWTKLNFTEGSSANINYLKLQGSSDGIYTSNVGSFSISNSLIEKNSNYGIYLSYTNANIDNCKIKTSGTGIYAASCSPQINNCSISDNNSNGLYFTSGTSSPIITNSTISNNNGYGINYNYGYGQIKVRNCQIIANTNWGIYFGGAYSGTEIKNCNIAGNSAGIYSNIYTSIENNTISANNGDGIYTASSGVTIYQNRISGNAGDGIKTLANIPISYNDIFNNGSDGIETSSSPTINYNNIYDNTEYDIRVTANPTATINAENNYWGTTIENDIKAGIWDFYDTGGEVAKVDYEPYFTERVGMLPVSGFVAQTLSGGQVKISWDTNIFAHQYFLYYDNKTGIIDTTTVWVTLDSTNLDYIAVLSDGEYKFGIRAEASDLRKSKLSVCTGKSDGTPPVLLAAEGVAGDSTITVIFDEEVNNSSICNVNNWSLSSGLILDRIQSYKLYLASGQILPSADEQITVICNDIEDIYGNQAGEQSYTFHPDDGNNNPSIALSNIDNEQSGDIRIDYVISDTEGDAVSLIPKYTSDGGANWHSATVTGNITNITQTNYTGYLVWNSSTDLFGKDIPNMKFKITPRDSDPHNIGTPGMTNAFNLDNNHSHSISIALAGTQEEYSDSVRISYTLNDTTYDLLKVSCYYKFDAIWQQATVIGDTSNIDSSKYSGVIIWNSIKDLPGKDIENLKIKVIPTDDWSDGRADSTVLFHLDNNKPPAVQLADISGEQSGLLVLSYELSDDEGDSLDIRLNYSINDGISWAKATVIGDTTGILEYTGSLIWNSEQDLPGADVMTVKLQLIPSDNDIGESDTTSVFHIDNNKTPTVVMSDLTGEQKDNITINYQLNDAENDTLSIWCEYYNETSKNWVHATITGDTSGITQYANSVIWQSRIDLPEAAQYTLFRITPSDNDIGLMDTTKILLDNLGVPSVTITTVMEGELSGDVRFDYVLSDDEGDTLTIYPEYSIDSGQNWNLTTVTGDTSDIDSSGYNGSLVWHSGIDLPGVDLYTVRFRITPTDVNTGIPGETSDFHLDNNDIPEVSLAEVPGVNTGDIPINYTLSDTEGDTLDIFAEYFYKAAQIFKPATVSGTMANLDSSQYSGDIIWRSMEDFANIADTVQFRMTATDNDTGLAYTVSIFVDNSLPSIALDDISGEQSGDVLISYEIANDSLTTVSIHCEYSIDSGNSWSNASITGDTSNIGFQNYIDSLIWNSETDLPGIDLYTVRFRITPKDVNTGIPDETADFHLDNNDMPEISLVEVPGVNTGDIPINYTLSDVEGDTLDIFAEYYDKETDLFKPATITGDITNLDSTGYAGIFVWNSIEDIPNVTDTILFRLTPADNDTGYADTISVFVDNNVPSITLKDIEGEQTAGVMIHYTVDNDSLSVVSIHCEYSIDSGNSWSNASVIGDTSNIGFQNYIDSLIWNSGTDLPGIDLYTVRFRITPYDISIGFADSTSAFHLDNNDIPIIDTLFTPVSEKTGDVELKFIATDAENDTLNYLMQYSTDSGENWQEPSINFDYNDIPASEDTLSFIWHSDQDIPNLDINTVMFQVTPLDNDTGLAGRTGVFHVDNETGPIVIGNYPLNFALWQDTIIIDFDRRIDTTSLHGNIEVSGTRSGEISGKNLFPDNIRSLFFIPGNPFMAKETLSVKLGAGILDSLGKGLDGDRDGDPEGSPIDDYSWQFYSPYLGDYDNSDVIDVQDLIIFSKEWSQENQNLLYEIGPALGELPYLDLDPDGVIDFEDFVTLARMWNYAVGLSKISTLFAENPAENNLAGAQQDIENTRSLAKIPAIAEETRPVITSKYQSVKNKEPHIPMIYLNPIISQDPWNNSRNGSFEVEIKTYQYMQLKGSQIIFKYNKDLLRFDGFREAAEQSESMAKSLSKSLESQELNNITGISMNSDKLILQHEDESTVLLDIVQMFGESEFVDENDNILILQFSAVKAGVSDIEYFYSAYGDDAELLDDGYESVQIDSKLLIPESFAIYQNYPNPFNPVTIIKYQIPTHSKVSVYIYDIQGRLVSELISKDHNPGYYSVKWNGKNRFDRTLSSGVYFYQLRAKSENKSYLKTKKMMILK